MIYSHCKKFNELITILKFYKCTITTKRNKYSSLYNHTLLYFKQDRRKKLLDLEYCHLFKLHFNIEY